MSKVYTSTYANVEVQNFSIEYDGKVINFTNIPTTRDNAEKLRELLVIVVSDNFPNFEELNSIRKVMENYKAQMEERGVESDDFNFLSFSAKTERKTFLN